jgi:hypothetical protein
MGGKRKTKRHHSPVRYDVATIEIRGHDESYAVTRRFGPLSSHQKATRMGREKCSDHYYEASGCDVTEDMTAVGIDPYDDDALEEWFLRTFNTGVKHFVTYQSR